MNKSLVWIFTLICAWTGFFGRAPVLAQSAMLPGSQQIVEMHGVLKNKTVAPGGRTQIAFTLKILPDYHIQSNTPSLPALIPTALSIKATDGLKVAKISYPQPKMESFAFSEGKQYAVFGDGAVIVATVEVAKSAEKASRNIEATLSYQGCDQNQCYPPQDASTSVALTIGDTTSADENAEMFAASMASTPLKENQQPNPVSEVVKRYGFLGVLGFAYLAGLLLNLTPCVFPLIPITLGYFRGQASDNRARTVRLALAYVVGLCMMYSGLGLVAATTGSLFGAWLSNPVVLALIAIIVAIMALSMFDLFELKAPAFISGRSGARAGLGGAFVMGMFFGVVAAPCTGPATIGLLTFVGQLAHPVAGFLIFFALGLGITTPLLGLAIFSGNLPRSGAWMEWVKHFLGALMLAAAVYFLKPLLGSQITNWVLGALAAGFAVWLSLFEKSGWQPAGLAVSRAVVGVLLLVFAVSMFIPKGPGIVWQPYSPEKVAAAQAAGKPVIIDFWATWCAACMELKEGAFHHKAAVGESEHFVRLSVDATVSKTPATQAALARYKVIGLPTVILIDRNGNEVGSRILGNLSGQAFAERLKQANRQK